ncbi:hypothetical protein [Paraburkholderia nodosa]|uniref:hypothetical protein n=1 Tax=Paraburkholderia nodosa TaxID=392320 RepID=UPI0004875041|nr:hypothetical protein [Paraburkholderia nodosa]
MRSAAPRPAIAQRSFNLQAALLAGLFAILTNTAILIMADHFHIVTARGGLLTLLLAIIGPPIPHWVTSWTFQQFFHIAVGIAMLITYATTLGSLSVPAIAKGLFAAALVWLANAALILPAIGQGFAGSNILSPWGMAIFAVAHTLFFLIGAVLYEHWT